ncbi:hypothetical protein HG66A1_42970 [Gimesia chilikensis]|uniref:Uncharacterized protein n=2 Tax=Gimesia chilikensis TaxID=2605989 RepID=A0A517PSZ3_9PLAN|nr:hypothetical protein HG66A1_42970 [Gimesia chilikensis]
MTHESTNSEYSQISASLFNQKYSFRRSTQLRLWGPEAGAETVRDFCYGLRQEKMTYDWDPDHPQDWTGDSEIDRDINEYKTHLLQFNNQGQRAEPQHAASMSSWGHLIKAAADAEGKLNITVIDDQDSHLFSGYGASPDLYDEIESFFINIPVNSSQEGATCLFLILTAQHLHLLKQLLDTPPEDFPKFVGSKSLEETLVPSAKTPEVQTDEQASSIVAELLEALTKENPDDQELTPEDRKARHLAQFLSHAPGRTGQIIKTGETFRFRPDQVELEHPCPSPAYGGKFWGFLLTK